MILLSYASGRNNYIRDGIYYLKIRQNLPEDVRDQFFRGGYTAQRKSECSAEYGLTWPLKCYASNMVRVLHQF